LSWNRRAQVRARTWESVLLVRAAGLDPPAEQRDPLGRPGGVTRHATRGDLVRDGPGVLPDAITPVLV
jgi:hypothetical protein